MHYKSTKGEIMTRAAPELKVELMRKSRFDSIKMNFNKISNEADTAIQNANSNDILAITMSFDNPVDVVRAELITPDDFFKEVFS